jgi:tetratricopeptide (TPR) repeat protein
VDLDPGSAGAHLHHGRVLDLRGHEDEALRELAAALDAKPDPGEAYLAHLFIGGIHERARRLPQAIEAYEQAVNALPAQSALLALAHATDANGDRPRALASLARLTSTQALGDDGSAAGSSAGRSPGHSAPDPWLAYGVVDKERLIDQVRTLLERGCP